MSGILAPMFQWDPTINAGTIISACLFIGVIFKLHGDIVRQLTALNVKVETMWDIYTAGHERDNRAG